MKIIRNNTILSLFFVGLSSSFLSSSVVKADGHCGKGATMVCSMIKDGAQPPVLDADTSEWADVSGGISPELVSIFGKTYTDGTPTFKCLFDSEKVYFMFEIPGKYLFNTTDNHYCASIGTMMPIGSQASFINMGNCITPDGQIATCPDGNIPAGCEDHLVDLGAHWELKTTNMFDKYDVNMTTPGVGGNDLVANKDDEFAVSPYCRPDDNDVTSMNEWAGAWSHSNPVDGEMGTYKFELSRSLTTASTMQDAQMAPGGVYDFGIAYWDPYETATGWTKAGHYLTGCSKDWIKLALDDGSNPFGDLTTDVTDETNGQSPSGVASSYTYGSVAAIASLLLAAAIAFVE